MKCWKSIAVLGCIALLLSGCKETLLSALSENSANQIIATLSQYKIDAEKAPDKSGQFSVIVDKENFNSAVMALQSNGLPRSVGGALERLFPPGQLISSPEQERAKLNAAREDKLSSMLYAISGVQQAYVAIGNAPQSVLDDGASSASVAVVIRYAPSIQMSRYEEQIRSVIKQAVPKAHDSDISITLFPAEGVLLPRLNVPKPAGSSVGDWFTLSASILAATAAVCALMLIGWRVVHGLIGRKKSAAR